MITLRVWRYPIVNLLVPVGANHKRIYIPFPAEIFDIPLNYDAFFTGVPGVNAVESDEISCPCGQVLQWGGTVGEALRLIDDHCGKTPGHPLPKRDD
jgi:hypothetical protein